MLTGKEIAQSGIISNFLEENIQQQGIDVRVQDIRQVDIGGGYIPAGNSRKTLTPKTFTKTPIPTTVEGCEDYWSLQEGYYEVTFMEGCNIPNDCCLQYKTRSSGIRCGGEIRSDMFDAGFKTDNMGAFLKVEIPMQIEKGARLAQVIVDRTNVVENTYNGQWQGDKQRDNQ